MPVEVKYIDDGIGVEFHLTGIVSGEDVLKANAEVYQKKRLQRQCYQILDRTQCDQYQISSEDIRKIAEQDIAAAKINPDIVIAIIASSKLEFGLSRMYQAYVQESGFVTEIFNDRDSAEEWLAEQLAKR